MFTSSLDKNPYLKEPKQIHKFAVLMSELGMPSGLKFLLKENKDLFLQYPELLSVAIKHGRSLVLSLILEHHPELITIKSEQMIKEVMLHEQYDILKLLLEYEYIIKTHGTSLLQLALETNKMRILEILAPAAVKAQQNNLLNEVLIHLTRANRPKPPGLIAIAVENDNLDALNTLIFSGSDLNQADRNNQTPVFKAVSKNHIIALSMLLDNGALINASPTAPLNPLYAAAYTGNVKALQLLIENGGNLNVLYTHLNEFPADHIQAFIKNNFLKQLQIILDDPFWNSQGKKFMGEAIPSGLLEIKNILKEGLKVTNKFNRIQEIATNKLKEYGMMRTKATQELYQAIHHMDGMELEKIAQLLGKSFIHHTYESKMSLDSEKAIHQALDHYEEEYQDKLQEELCLSAYADTITQLKHAMNTLKQDEMNEHLSKIKALNFYPKKIQPIIDAVIRSLEHKLSIVTIQRLPLN